MSKMVERVEKAITDITGEHFGDYDERIARAAIEAMREPTNAMYAAANDAFVPASDAAACWHAMIDAALKD